MCNLNARNAIHWLYHEFYCGALDVTSMCPVQCRPCPRTCARAMQTLPAATALGGAMAR